MATEESTNQRYFGVFDLFKIGIGPSSSHSVGPMRAAAEFVAELNKQQSLNSIARVEVELFGSLALTGKGHMTDLAVMLGLTGEQPDTIDPDAISHRVAEIRRTQNLTLGGEKSVSFIEKQDLIFNRRKFLDGHPNALTLRAFADAAKQQFLHDATYFSIGGGFIIREGDLVAGDADSLPQVPYPFSSGRELLELAAKHDCSFSSLARSNERVFRSDTEIDQGLDAIWDAMQECVRRGCATEGILPGGLNVRRRAPELFRKLSERDVSIESDPMCVLDWVDLFALAVNEENAAGGRVVTAPTNGAAGIVPAVLHYLEKFRNSASAETVRNFLLTAAVIGSLYKRNASISGAEVGCQGEVGVACSMAAAALTEVLGGTPRQVEEAAEIGMEHNLGLTCDPIKGLVQVPCIERNAMGAVKAINASRMALRGDGEHCVVGRIVIRVMKRTGADMSARYKETSQGGLAVNISEC